MGRVGSTRLRMGRVWVWIFDPYNNRVGSTQPDYYMGRAVIGSGRPDPTQLPPLGGKPKPETRGRQDQGPPRDENHGLNHVPLAQKASNFKNKSKVCSSQA